MHLVIYLSLISFLLLLFIRNSLSCICMPSHPQKAFCDGDFALKFKVIAKDFVYGNFSHIANGIDTDTSDVILPIETYDRQWRYTVCDLVIYQGFSKLYKVNKRYIFTTSNIAWCSLQLEVGKRYATIGGSVESNQLHMDGCQPSVRLDSLSGHTQRFILFNLAVLYRRSCDCKVHVCGRFVNNCMRVLPTDVCQTELFRAPDPLHWYDICVPWHRRGKCAWSWNKASSSPNR